MSNLEGFDEVEEELEKLEKKAEELEQGQDVSFEKLFNPSFMKKYTQFRTIDEMFGASEFEIETEEDFENIPEDELDKFVDENTKFSSWEEMSAKAGEVWAADQLGLE